MCTIHVSIHAIATWIDIAQANNACLDGMDFYFIVRWNSIKPRSPGKAAAFRRQGDRNTAYVVDSFSLAASDKLLNRRRVCSADRKYLSSTDSSKMSNKVHSLPVLGNAEMF